LTPSILRTRPFDSVEYHVEYLVRRDELLEGHNYSFWQFVSTVDIRDSWIKI